MTPESPVNPESTNPRNLIGLYSAWRLDDHEDLPHPTDCAPDFHIETRIATFIVEPSILLKSSARMARRDAFPLDDAEAEELGTCFVDDAIATYMESLDGWFELPAAGDLSLAKRMDDRLITHGLTRFITDPADLAATLKRHGLPEAWAVDRDSEAWRPAPRRGPTFDEFLKDVNDFVDEYNDREARHRRTAANKSRGGFER
ncbi:MAG: hypothetical protein GY873_15995 [Bosea sp.]|uniref:hypothetical protein n=1 Tax=Bosea sp. (in: a-proteobacteria) TaxID=1871050 RepID=UPI0023835DCF|nr:hypothetical protein [Bosea sp. (in: a-proteobacteria)]MCP4735688.1 hypothetical protein [Bosea sp. (in: a-proteobacteria)]